ncbi:MAG: hypothetical protein IJ026_05630 [Candidatus Methanomethylophilaceae archaeon]|nr:hypothetical protein [Candidatus Methanomethylophilaceae archaeon]
MASVTFRHDDDALFLHGYVDGEDVVGDLDDLPLEELAAAFAPYPGGLTAALDLLFGIALIDGMEEATITYRGYTVSVSP